MPAANLFTQLGGGIVAILTGRSVDTEGPSVHIGAAIAGRIGQAMRISAEEDYTLTTCGRGRRHRRRLQHPAGGRHFVIEVLWWVRYSVPALDLSHHWELPNLLLLGLVIGMLAIGFISLCEAVALHTRTWSNPPWWAW